MVSPPIAYRRMRHRLLERGAAVVDIAPVRVFDWAWAGCRGFGPLQGKVAAAIRHTFERGGGRPIVVVGHSGGGLLARLAMCDAPYRGRVGGVAPMVGCLVTLGSPHDLHLSALAGDHEGTRLAAFLAERSPGARFAPATAYLTVASDVVPAGPGIREPPPRGSLDAMRRRFFRRVVGPPMPPGGDGIVPLALAHLEGARQLTLHEALHGVVGAPWYGDAVIVDTWWPQAVSAWRDVVSSRRDAVAGRVRAGHHRLGTQAGRTPAEP
jgi:hypothetical protein